LQFSHSPSAMLHSVSDMKAFLERASSVSMDAMHVIGGVVLFVAFAVLLRRPITSWLPWVCLLMVVFVNELADLTVEKWPNPAEQFGEAAKDVLLTMLLPTLLMAVGPPRGGA
jgi:hypothetical protein